MYQERIHIDRATYQEAKKNFDEIAKLLREGNLTLEEKQKFETMQAQLAGVLLNPWLPFDWGRRAIMITLFCVGVFGIISGINYLLLAWLILLIFSPRLIGEVSNLFGTMFNRKV
jgi:hypothetical protein